MGKEDKTEKIDLHGLYFVLFIVIIAFFLVASRIPSVDFTTPTALDIPTVYKSWSSRKCVKVKPGSCDKLPERYHRIWVK